MVQHRFEIIVAIIAASMMISCSDSKRVKDSEEKGNIYEVMTEKPLEMTADLNGDGVDEKIVFELDWEDESMRMSILKIKIFNRGNIVYDYILPSGKNKVYNGFYFIQRFRYISNVTKDVYRDLLFIYAGGNAPELYIVYCQPEQYTEGHRMIADEKYDVLDTGIRLEKFY